MTAAFLRTVALAAIAGAAATYLGAPLPWMIGPLVVLSVIGFAGFRPHMPDWLRDWMIAVIGVLLGGAFDPDVFSGAEAWWVTLGAMVVCTLAMLTMAPLLLTKVFRRALLTAFYSAAPGSLSQMIAQASGSGADVREVAVVHTIRVVFVILSVPIVIVVFFAGETGGAGPARVNAEWPSPFDAVLLAGSLLFFPLARRLRLPSAPLVGPLLASALLHYTGIVTADPPGFLIAAAQLVLASNIASRLAATKRTELMRFFAGAMVVTATLSVISLMTTYTLWRLTDLPFLLLLLAFAPGGTSEIVLISIALNQDAAFISMHHLLRMLIILTLTPFIAAALSKIRHTYQ